MVKKILIKEDENTGRVRLNFKSAGINRVPENDFSDDGARFRAYEYDGVPITYTTYNGDGFLAIRIDELASEKMNYDEYSKLPSYRDADKYNGVSISSIDLEDVKRICKRLKAEFEEALSKLEDVDDKEVLEILEKISKIHKDQIDKILHIVSSDPEKVLNLHELYFKRIHQYYGSLSKSSIPRDISKMSQAEKRRLISNRDYYIERAEDDFYYREILELLNK